MKTIDELIEEVLAEVNQRSLHRVEADIEEDEFFKLTLEERLDLLPF
jgi:hypothetical protein